MGRAFSRSVGAVLSVAVVGTAGWALSVPYYRSVFASWENTVIDTFYDRDAFNEANSWPVLDADSFAVRAPRETSLRKDSRYSGAFVDRRYILKYELGSRVDDGSGAKAGRGYSEEQTAVDGRPAVFRAAEFPDRAEPYFLELYVPQAVRRQGGGWYALEIHGWFMSGERLELARKMLRTVDFAPARLLSPKAPRVEPPTFDIAPPPA